MSRSKNFFSAILLSMLVGPGAAMAAETLGGPGTEAQAGEETPTCQDKIGIKGRPHKISTVARLAAVSAWTEMAKKHGADYAMWHNAKSSNIKCKKLPRSEFILCFATGKPCHASSNGKTASNKTN